MSGDHSLSGDHGLFGPGSVTWRVMGEPIMFIGGLRALFLQALHPPTMRAVAQNSDLVDPDRAWARFQRTAEFVRIRTYGSTAEVERAGRRIRALHRRLRARDPQTGASYRIDDPVSLTWVHCCEVDSYLAIARRCGIPLSPPELDAFVDEQRRAAAVVGLAPDAVPGSAEALREYFIAMRPHVWACPEARTGLLRSFSPALPGKLIALRLAAPALSGLAFATLPSWARRRYGTPGIITTDIAATTWLKVLYRGTTLVPEALRYSPDARRARRLTGAA